jgi:hypothetical protein
MNKLHLTTALCAALAVSILGVRDAAARLVVPERWERITVITVDGWEYPNVTVELVDAGQALRVTRADGARREFALAEIRELQDSIGRDVTAHVIPGWRGRPAEGPPPTRTGPERAAEPRGAPHDEPFVEVARSVASDNPAADQPLLATRFAVALAGAAGYGKPLGRWFDGFGGGESYSGQLRLAVTGNVYIHGLYRYQRLPYEGGEVALAPGLVTASGDLELRQLLFGLGFMPRRSDWRQAIPYLELGYGRTTHERAVGAPPPGADFEIVGESDVSIDEPTVFAQVGVIMPLGREIALEMGVNAVHTGDDLLRFGEDDASGTIVSGRLGLTLLLGQSE